MVALLKFCLFFLVGNVFQLLESAFSAPCHGLKSSCEPRAEAKLKSIPIADTLTRILIRPNNITNEDRFLSALFTDATEALFGDQDIIFPDSYELVRKTITKLPATPDCANNGLSFCEDIDSYPYNRLKNILPHAETHHSEFFGVDEAPPEIANRVGQPEESFICGSIDTTIFPKAAKNKNNKWKYVINQGENEGYIQGIRIEKCLKLNGRCNLITDAPIGYVARCKQKYILRRLLSISENGQPVPDSFQIPSACCCSFKRDFSFLAGYGRNAATTTARTVS